MAVYGFGDIIQCGDKMFLFLNKNIIYDLNHRKLIDNYKYRGKDNYVYIPLKEIPNINQKNIFINDKCMFDLRKTKRQADLVKPLPININDTIKLTFIDGTFLIKSKKQIQLDEINLCKLMDVGNYVQIIDSIINKEYLTFDFYYNKDTKLYIHKIKYLNTDLKTLENLDDNCIFDILNSLIDVLSNNNLTNYNLNDGTINISAENSICINLYNFSNEFIIYIIDKLQRNNLGKTI